MNARHTHHEFEPLRAAVGLAPVDSQVNRISVTAKRVAFSIALAFTISGVALNQSFGSPFRSD